MDPGELRAPLAYNDGIDGSAGPPVNGDVLSLAPLWDGGHGPFGIKR